jgi:hypothetical protein
VELSLHERDVMVAALGPSSPVLAVLNRFCDEQRSKCEARSAEGMRSIPRRYEEASDYASKAEAYEKFLTTLIREIEETEVED